jgi:hypothetical protein
MGLMWWFVLGFLLFQSCQTKRIIYLEYSGDRCLHHTVDRYYLNDSVFIDRHTYSTENKIISTLVDTFKVIDQVWYHWECNAFFKYFDKNDFLKKNVQNPHCVKNPNTLEPRQVDTLQSKMVYRFSIIGQQYNYFAPEMYFDPEIGTVKMVNPSGRCENEELVLIRKSRKWKPLK